MEILKSSSIEISFSESMLSAAMPSGLIGVITPTSGCGDDSDAEISHFHHQTEYRDIMFGTKETERNGKTF